MTSREKYEEWLRQRDLDETLRQELLAVGEDEEAIEDLFYKDLSFGTSGLRGKMGPGTTGMNVHVVARATQGVADYLNSLPEKENGPSCAIAYDSRINSRKFAEVTARVLCANGIRVYMYREISPVASLSYAIRRLGLDLGIMITASHNPKEYNGYKVYDETGCQIVGDVPDKILACISQHDYFTGIRGLAFGLTSSPLFHYIGGEVLDGYMEEALKASLPAGGMGDLTVVYSPLHGTGNRFVTHVLLKAGVGHLFKVKSQESPDGTFPGCPIPNPERIDVFKEGIRICDKVHGDLLLATDPDCDRVGVAVRIGDGQYWYPTGNQIGILLCQYLCANRDLPEDPVMVRSIVSSPLIDRICEKYGVRVETTLTGFKYIGKKMDTLGKRFLLGFEEGNGYLAATHVRDKDGVSAAVLITQMAAFYKSRGMDLADALFDIYEEYGYMREETRGFTFEGMKGAAKMQSIMERLRKERGAYYPEDEFEVTDYLDGIDDLPKSDVLQFAKSDCEKTIIRPSGTEPKIKAYVFARGETKDDVRKMLDEQETIVDRIMKEEDYE